MFKKFTMILAMLCLMATPVHAAPPDIQEMSVDLTGLSSGDFGYYACNGSNVLFDSGHVKQKVFTFENGSIMGSANGHGIGSDSYGNNYQWVITTTTHQNVFNVETNSLDLVTIANVKLMPYGPDSQELETLNLVIRLVYHDFTDPGTWVKDVQSVSCE